MILSFSICLEECPDLEGIETILSKVLAFGRNRLEECPDLEGIETCQHLE